MRGRTYKATAVEGRERNAFPKLFAQLGISPPDSAFTRRAVQYARDAMKRADRHKQPRRIAGKSKG